MGEAREALIAVTIPERKGAFREFCGAIGRRVVTEFNYRLSGRNQAHIFVGFATQSRQDADALISQLRRSGYETVDLTDNEMAYMGRAVKGGRTHWDFGHHHDTDHDKSHCLPANLHKGDSIIWWNKDFLRHTATAADKSFNVDLPAGAKGKITLTKTGMIPFVCRFHPGMRGILQVK